MGVGIYRDRLLPRLVNRTCGAQGHDPLRGRVCSELSGRVLELGFGSGLNVPFYPETVDSVVVVEPADLAWQLAQSRVNAARAPIERAGRDATSLPFPDASFDTALSTWTMCTIPEIGTALAEVRRVLVPGATLHFVEHGLAPDPGVQKWQHRLDPVQRVVGGGCHLNRNIPSLIEDAGFRIRDIDIFYGTVGPRFIDAQQLGVAVPE